MKPYVNISTNKCSQPNLIGSKALYTLHYICHTFRSQQLTSHENHLCCQQLGHCLLSVADSSTNPLFDDLLSPGTRLPHWDWPAGLTEGLEPR